MIIESITLVGCKRLLIRNVHSITIDFTSPWQIIIGCNGSGKTTVLRHCSPLKAEPKQFTKQGRKEIIFKDKGKRYKSISTFEHGSHHELWDLDRNENLNPGRTGSIHSQLVKGMFGLDQELFDVLVGKVLFTNMPAPKRQEWLLKISQMDMTFAMTVYHKLRTQLNESKGLEKHFTKRLADEISKLPSSNELEGLEEHCEKLTENLNVLLRERIPRFPSVVDAKRRFEDLLGQCHQLSKAILKINFGTVESAFTDLTDLETYITQRENRLESIKGELSALYVQHEEASMVLRTLEDANVKGLAELMEKTESLRTERDALFKKCQRFKIAENVDAISQQSHVVIPLLSELLELIPVNQELRFSKFDNDTLRRRLETDRQTLNTLIKHCDRLTDELHHTHNAETLQCPQCAYSWVKGRTEQELKKKSEELDKVFKEKTLLEGSIKKTEELEAGQHQYQHFLRKLNQLVKQNPLLGDLWKQITDEWQSGQYPKRIINLLSIWQWDLDLCLQAWMIQQLITEQEKVHQSFQNTQTGSTQRYQLQCAALHDRINLLINEQSNLSQDVQRHVQYKNAILQMEKHHQTLQNAIREGSTALGTYTTAIEQEGLQALISENQTLLAKATLLLQTASQAKAIIEDISHSKEEARKQTETLTALVQELSPVDGLIAEQLTYFITQFVHQINDAINHVWTYSLRVLPCAKESGELTYNFPMQIHGSPDVAPDVSEGSTSQLDMINFAFRLVVMKYLGMEDWPLYLDELAPSLDEKHRLNIVEFVKYLIETHKCSQLFMISHYMYTSSAFTRAEVCVMDENNILTLPSVYNKHVKMH